MILFRFISFGLRVIFSFLFVFILQVRWNEKSLEHYLTQFAKSFFVTEVLSKVSHDGVKVMEHITRSKKLDKESAKRDVSSLLQDLVLDAKKRLELPEELKKESY